MIVFRNPGLIDMAAVRTMGVSVKEGDNPIGYFGTGLKFAIATILRGGGRITIYRGTEVYIVGVDRQVIREQEFDVITINNEPLGFTTQLGRDWKPWMAFRELASNCRDEGGRYYSDMGDARPQDGETMICVAGGGIEDAYHERDGIMVSGEPLYANELVEVRAGETPFVYYRGVRVGQLGKSMTHQYNILSKIDLTEDRTFKHAWEVGSAISRGIMQCDDETILKRALTCGGNYLEHGLDLPSWQSAAPAFERITADLRGSVSDVANANPYAMDYARARRLSTLGPDHSIDLNPVEQQMMDRALELLKAGGYPIDAYPVTVVANLGKGVHGLAKEGRIFIAQEAFAKGTREVAATLLEEWSHLKSGHGDASRGLQNFLFDQVLCQIEHRAGGAF